MINKKYISFKKVTNRWVVFAFTGLCCFGVFTVLQAAPQGGQVVAGSGSIQSFSDVTQINQNSQQLIIDWDSFDVAPNESVNFIQPNSRSAVLNRIYDQNPSQIFGSINANGQVFLSNPNGLIFGANSQVNVGSLFATTLDVDNDSFFSNRYNFSAISEGGIIVNHGLLNAATGGSISLVADAVDNQGDIVAHYGYINLASGRTATIDFDGDGLIHFEIDGEVLNNATGNTVAVNNSGVIQADGGEVLLTARNAEDIFERAINNDGLIAAGRMLNDGGVIRLVGIGGDVVHSGVIDVSAQDADSTGGEVQILGDRVGLFDAAVVDASGSSGGGTVLVGGDFQGGNSAILNASQTLVSRDSRITVDAQQSGDGGRVIIWADGYTRFLGDISATGGALAGNGGFVEVSGKQQLGFDGQVDTTADNGVIGQLLLDPTNITIDSPSNPVTVTVDDVNDFTDSVCADCTISAATLIAANATITLQATNNIIFSESLTLDENNSLVAQANNDIIIGVGVTVGTQGRTAGITLEADVDGINGGIVAMEADSTLQTAGGDVIINTNAIKLEEINAGTGAININATNINGADGSNLTAATLTLNASAGGIGISGNEIHTTVDSLALTTGGADAAGDIYIVNSTALNSSQVTFNTTGSGTQTASLTVAEMTIDGSLGNSTDNLSLTSNTGIVGGAGSLSALTLRLIASDGSIGTSGSNINTNAISLNADASANGGDIYISESNAITLGTVNAGTGNINIGATDINDAGGSNLIATALSLNASIGGIGSSGNEINTTVATLSADASASDGDIYINETNAVTLGTINAGTGNINISATDINDAGGADLTAATLTLNASAGGIGAAGDVINISLSGALNATASAGDIYINDSATLTIAQVTASGNVGLTAAEAIIDDEGDNSGIDVSAGGLVVLQSGDGVGESVTDALNISADRLAVTSAGGDVYLTEDSGIALAVIDAGGNAVNINVAGSITASSALITAGNLSLKVGSGSSIGTSGANINTDLSGTLNITATGAGGVYINETDISATDGLSLATIDAGSGNVGIVSAGDILGASSSSLVLGNMLTIESTSGSIGSATESINTTVATLNATANTGMFIANSSALSLAGISAGNGDIDISSGGPMTINTGAASLSSLGSQRYAAPIINLYDSLSTTNSAITLNGNVVLFDSVSLNTDTDAGDVVITGTVDSDNNMADSLSILAGSGNVDLLGEIGRTSSLYGLDVATSGTLFLNGDIATNDRDISLSAGQINLADTIIWLSTGNGAGDISLSGNVDSVGAGSTQLTLRAGTRGNVDLSNAVVGSLISFDSLDVAGNSLLLSDVTTNYFQTYVGATTISGDAAFAVTSTDADSIIRFLSPITGSSTNNLSITAPSTLGRVNITSTVNSVSNLSISGEEIKITSSINDANNLSVSGRIVAFGAPASIAASDSISLTLGDSSSVLSLGALGTESLGDNTDQLSISTPGSIVVDVAHVNSALTLSATGGSGSRVVFNNDSTFAGNLVVRADDGIAVNARIETTSAGADINLNSDANDRAETNDNIVFSTANIISGGSLIMSATNGGIELDGGLTAADGTTRLNIPNGGLDIQGISIDGQSNASLVYILDIVANDDVLLGDIGQTNLIDSLSVTTSGNDVYLYGDISTRRSGGIDLANSVTTVILENDVFLDTSTGNGSVSLAAVEGAQTLSIDSGNGGILLAGIGQNTTLTALNIRNQGVTELTGSITTSGIGGIDFSGAQNIDITDSISLAANNGGTIDLTGGVVNANSGGLILASTGTTRVGGELNVRDDLELSSESNIVVDSDFSLTSSSAILGGNLSTSAGVDLVDLSGAGAIVLNNDLLLDTSASNANIDISGVDITGNGSLNVVHGTGAVTLNNILGLTSISISGSGLTTLAGDLTTSGTGGVDLGNASNILLGSNVSIDTRTNSGLIDLTGGRIEGARSLTLTTNDGAILLGNMGQSEALSSLTINSTGSTTFDNAVISTGGSGISLTAASDINIVGDVVLNSNSGSGAVHLDGGAVDGTGGLTINVNRGDLFIGAVGQDVPLAYLTVSGSDQNQISGNIATLGNVDFSAANIDSIDPAIDLLINAGSGDVSFAEVGADVPFLSLTVVTSGSVNLSDNITTQGAGIDFRNAGSVILSDGSDITIDTSLVDDGAILLNNGLSIDGDGSLNLVAALGDIALGHIGQTTAIASLTTSNTGVTTLSGDATSVGDISINSGSTNQNGNITSTTGTLDITSETDIVMDEAATSTTAGQPVNYTSTTGDLYVAQIDAGTGIVTLNAPLGNVYSSLGDNINLALSQPNITSSTAIINSGSAIGRTSASAITIDASSSISLTFGAGIAYINNVQGVPVRSSGRVIDVLVDREVMAAVGHSGGLEADAVARKKDDFDILPQEQSLFLIAGPNNQFAAQYDDVEVISIINPDVPTLLYTKDAWIFQRQDAVENEQRGARWF